MRRAALGRPVRMVLTLALVAASCSWTGALPAGAATAPSSQPPAPFLPRDEIRHGFQGPVSPSHRPLTGGGCSPLFSVVTSPNAANFNELEAVAPIYPSDIWAVGHSNTGATNAPNLTLAEHWNGSTWTRVATPNVGTARNDLTGVAANDPNDVWAVGESKSGTVFKTLAMHWNGSSWAVVTSPQPSTTVQALGGVSALASNNVWAAGLYENGSNLFQTLVIHWNGSAWTTVPSPNAGTGDNVLETVFARAADDVWAVGHYSPTPGAPNQTLIEHWNGSAWSIQTSPSPASGENILFNVSASSATDVWAVGYTDTGGGTVAQTLTEHLVSGTWTTVASPNNGTGDNLLTGLVAISPSNVWATGFGWVNPTAGGSSLAEHWDGASWTIRSADNPGPLGNALFGVAALPGNDVWAVGGNFQSGVEYTLTEQFQLPAPTAVSAAASDQSATVSWTAPACDGPFPTTSYLVTASDGCTVQMVEVAASSPYTFIGLTNGSPFQFVVQAVSTSLGPETPSAPSAAIIPTGATVPAALTACSSAQYSLANPSPSTFVDIDSNRLKLQVTPAVDSLAVITGNADLWTATAGINQDLGIDVNGSLVGWKESGGYAGTFSPNAAAIQTVVPLTGGTPYTVKLQWKSNKAATGAKIFAAAGPLKGDYRFSAALGFSPTRLSMRIVPVSAVTVLSVSSTSQYSLSNSNGASWVDIDSVSLSEPVSPASDSLAVITGNADLFTANAGYNQDIAINVDGSVAAWKESGGFAGTFSPNAALVQAVIPLTAAGSPHTIKLQWKTNKPAAGVKIYAGAGPLPSTASFSPTRLTVALLPITDVNAAASNLQYHLANSDGAGWNVIDSTTLKLSFASGVLFYTYLFSGNADLWTANAGYNQDVGIFISGGVYGSGTLVAWKESGGYAGTFSPNAAYVESVQHLQGGITYTYWLAWKTNKQAAGKTIYAAAGPLPITLYSPTTLAAYKLSSP